MQLTARQREFVRIAGWALPVSITLGAVFGDFQAQNGSVWGYVHVFSSMERMPGIVWRLLNTPCARER